MFSKNCMLIIYRKSWQERNYNYFLLYKNLTYISEYGGVLFIEINLDSIMSYDYRVT